MKKYYYLAALAATVLAGCTSDDFVGDVGNGYTTDPMEAPIVFTSNQQAFTRADFTGAEAADLLGKKFVVFGYKGDETKTLQTGGTVFDNYLVQWTENSANTTESNSSNWEYVGNTPIAHAITNGITSQTIKYWDYSQPQYDFFAWSTGNKTAIYSGTTPGDGEVLVSAMKATKAESGDVPNTGLKDAYTFQGKAEDLAECYISDLVTVKKADYNKPVTLKFRQLGTKVRIAIYETVPGYSVKDVQFYTGAATDDAQASNAYLFTTSENQIFKEGTYTVYFPTVDTPSDADNNQAHIKFSAGSATQDTKVNWGSMNYTGRQEAEKGTGNIYLGRTSNTASFAGAAANNYYAYFLPNESGTNLNLRVNYTLESIDGSGEVINVKGATAQVPLIYNQWKPGYAYTYIFKISDKTNGYTGVYDPTKPDDITVNSDPAGLYPITFDALVENAEDGDRTQETITTISTPSITTYQKGSNVVNNDEYIASTGAIFVTVNDGNEEKTPDLAHGKVVQLIKTVGDNEAALYTLPSDKVYTEADVVDAMQMQDDDAAANTVKGRSGLVLTKADFTLVNSIEYGVDGNSINLTSPANAMKFTPSANTNYAFVYTKTAQTEDPKAMYQPVDFNNATVASKYRFKFNAVTTPGDVQKDVVYLTKSDDVYTKKSVFIGQGTGNLYTYNGSTYTPATTDYAVTGTTYFYTLDGTTYKEADNVAYADFSGDALFVQDGYTYKSKTDSKPVDGTAYYHKESDGSYTYCVILPEQTNTPSWFTLSTTEYEKATETDAVDGITYFDRYFKNDAVRYVKVIKVQ